MEAVVTRPMLTEGEYASRCAGILADFMGVIDDRKERDGELVMDGTRLFSIIEAMATLIAEMEPQMVWAKVPERLPYN